MIINREYLKIIAVTSVDFIKDISMLEHFEPYLDYDNRDVLEPLLTSIFISNPELLLTWEDIQWLHQNQLALRDTDAKNGKQELEGGKANGDSHALAGFALNTNLNPWIDRDNVGDIRALLESNEIEKDENLKAKLVENFNIALLMTIKQSFDCHNPNGELIMLVKNPMSQRPYDLNTYYYFGKCGKGTNENIIACIKPKLDYEQQTPYGKYPKEYATYSKDVASMFLSACRMIKAQPNALVLLKDEEILQLRQAEHDQAIENMNSARDWPHLKSMLYLYQCEWQGYREHNIKGLRQDINDELIDHIDKLMQANESNDVDTLLSKLPDTDIYQQIIKPALENIKICEPTSGKDNKTTSKLK